MQDDAADNVADDMADTLAVAPLRGVEVIADCVTRLPGTPGVYRMIDDQGDVLYVGKARNLKKRVASYTRLARQTVRIARMIQKTVAMEFVSTQTETEALLLEANLIKRFRPRFNVLLRDDKSFPYILIADDHAAPRIMKHRGARTRKGAYFGPFASAGAVERTVNAMQRAFLVRSCSDSIYENRTRPCLLYQIKRCAAPCTGVVRDDVYLQYVAEAKAFLSGKSNAIKKDLAEQMEGAAEALNFEQAAIYRDRLAALSHVQSHQGINPRQTEEADVFAIYQEGGQNCIQVFFFRTGQNWGNRAYFPKADKTIEASGVLESFLAQFYDDKPAPCLILVSDDFAERELLACALEERAERKVQVLVPKRGEKRELVDNAHANAREALGRRLAETSSQARLLEGLAEVFHLDNVPKRIEVYDNSHIMGAQAVGAMIVAGLEGFVKNQYRKFNIKSKELTPGDDFGMMREVLTRRFSRLLKENHGDREPIDVGINNERGDKKEIDPEDYEEAIGSWPDFLIIDGGKGQLSAAYDVLNELGIENLSLIGVAKGPERNAGRETFYQIGHEPFMLQPRDPVLYFVQRLRDEAHRFAIGSHRAKRKKELTKNPLDDIAGIGPTRKRALLLHFGTVKAISRAALADLEAVSGISAAMARIIYDYFQDG